MRRHDMCIVPGWVTIAGDGFRCPLSSLSHLVAGYGPK